MGPTEFKDGWKSGLGGGAGIGYRLDEEGKFSARVSLSYCQPRIGRELFQPASRVNCSDAKRRRGLLPDGVGGNEGFVSFRGKASPYGLLGVGYARFKVDDASVSGGGITISGPTAALETKLAPGVGIDISLKEKISLFIEVRYELVFTEVDKTGSLPVRIGLSFN